MDALLKSSYETLTLEEYYVLLSPRLKGLAAVLLDGDRDTAEDIIHNVFEKLMRNQLEGKNELDFKAEKQATTFFFKCVVHACTDYFRKEAKHRNNFSLFNEEFELASPIDFESDLFSETGHQELLSLATSNLKGRQLQVFQMIHIDELSQKEIADTLGIKPNSVYTANCYAKKKLETLVKNLEGEHSHE